MKILNSFDYYLKEGVIKKVREDTERGKNLLIESKRKINSLNEKLEKIGIKEENANDYVEHCYDIIMLLIRAKLFMEGYKSSGYGSHEAEVSYLRVLGFEENDVQFADKMRLFRNGILYYGAVLDKEYAVKVIDFLKKIYPKLKILIKEN